MKTMEKHDKYPAHGGDCKQNNIRLDFSVNINPLGPPKSVLNALKNPASLLGKYPTPDQYALRKLLEAKRNIPMDRILIGNGASEIISILAGAIATRKLKNSSTENSGNILPVASVIAPTFSGYERALLAYGFDIKYFELTECYDFRFNESFIDRGIKDIDNLDLVILCNPNNPTGEAIPKTLIKKIADECQKRDIILAIDETFMGLVNNKSKYSCESILGKNKNLILIDAFTKLYAIPGVRLGYCATYNEELLKAISFIKPEWSVSTFAEAAGIAALSENSYIDEAITLIEKEKKYLLKELSSLGFCPQEGDAPFILFSIPQKYNAKTFYDKMIKDHGILLRNCSNFHGLDDHYFRIGIKKHEENVELMKALKNVSSYCSQGTRLQQ
ncbi:L-threonine O-3-phosphate decarboxylase [Butyrivibrio sp. INlla21]|nr:L-threonine O-3-phosphate decarboxylase [Butyrivibrio sp. INlla21]